VRQPHGQGEFRRQTPPRRAWLDVRPARAVAGSAGDRVIRSTGAVSDSTAEGVGEVLEKLLA
jgi:hypothetical protein